MHDCHPPISIGPNSKEPTSKKLTSTGPFSRKAIFAGLDTSAVRTGRKILIGKTPVLSLTSCDGLTNHCLSGWRHRVLAIGVLLRLRWLWIRLRVRVLLGLPIDAGR